MGNLIKRHYPHLALKLHKIDLISRPPPEGLTVDRSSHIPLSYFIYHNHYSGEWEEAWQITEQLTQELQGEANGLEADFAVVIVTAREQVHPDLWQRTIDTWPMMNKQSWDLDKPQRILKGIFEKQNIKFVDLLPAFRAYTKKTAKRLHLHKDGHWSVEGHRLAAELIYTWLIKQNLIPGAFGVK